MADKYVVYVAAPGEPPSPDARLRLADLLGLDLPKLDTLLRRLPAEVTKPVPESTAVTVARRFREAGLAASIRSADTEEGVLAADQGGDQGGDRGGDRGDYRGGDWGGDEGGNQLSTENNGTENNGSHRRSEGRADYQEDDNRGRGVDYPGVDFQDSDDQGGDDWRDEFGPPGSRPADEDQLFPPSAFKRPPGAKAPSKPLVIAFVIVLAILVALWIAL